MNPEYLRPLADHLWQSTLFAGTAGLLTLFLRTNRARVRHWLWLMASCKFLIPLSLLIAVGGHLASRTTAPRMQSGLSVVVQEVGQPFADPSDSIPVLRGVRAPSLFPAVLLTLWMGGFAGIALSWWIRWRRIRATVQRSRSVQLAIPISVKSSPSFLEPGIFGIFQPVLLLP
jgi:bla regulator protein blaR1